MVTINTPDIVAEIVASGSRCEIVRRVTEDERGDSIDVRCGAMTKEIGRALKGLSLDKISECHVVVILNAVNFPKLLGIDNCRGPIRIDDLGHSWTARLSMKHDVASSRLEYISYEPSSQQHGCYKLTITYDVAAAGGQNTAYDAKSEQYCVGNPKR